MTPPANPEQGAGSGGPARVLVLGGGGREHALVWSLAREASVTTVIVAPGSDAIAGEPKTQCRRAVAASDPAQVVDLATREDVDLVVVGPEAPLAAGVVDALLDAGVPTFGPTRGAAQIESSKTFCRSVAEAAGVRIARGGSFDDFEAAMSLACEIFDAPGSAGVVVKADGLMAGKGVTVTADMEVAEAALRAVLVDHSGGQTRVVVEELLTGVEASLIALCDDHAAIALPPARDHKRLLDGDHGPNTGGMGAYSPLPDLPESLCATLIDVIHVPILAELARRGHPFRGALYAGLMLTPEGPVLLECNARFGDPETQALLPRLTVPLGQLLYGAAQGDLAAAAAKLGLHGQLLPTTGDSAVAVVLAAANYPGEPRRGDVISGLDDATRAGAKIFHAGTARGPDGAFRTDGGRVLAVVGLGATLGSARDHAESAAGLISWDGMQRRRDIARKVPPAADARAATLGPAPISAAGWGGEGRP